jgi:predicted outer membrane protein
MRGKSLIVLAGLLAMAPASFGDDVQLDGQEIAFLRQRASDDIFVWRLSEYASDHAATDAVKQLAKDVVKERRTDLRDIDQLAQDHKADVPQPKDMTLQQKSKFDALTQQSGVIFDRGYTKTLAQDYGVAIPQLQREKDQAGHDAIRDYARKNLEMFKDHQKQAEDAEKVAFGS